MTSNQVQKVLGSISKLLECAICLDLLKNPIATRCHHHFCRFCMTEFLKTKTSVPCPLCKEPVTRRSLQDQDRLSDIVEHVRGLITAYQEDTGEFFSPPRRLQGTDFFPCTPEPIFPRETTERKRQTRSRVKQATKSADRPEDGAPARSHEPHEETAANLDTRLPPPVSQPRNTSCTAVRKTRQARQGQFQGEEERNKKELDERQASVIEQEAALLKYLVEGSCGLNTNVAVHGCSIGTEVDLSVQVFSGAGDTLNESSTSQKETRVSERKGDNSCYLSIGTDMDESFNRETKSVGSAKTLINRDTLAKKGDNSCMETMDNNVNESFKAELNSLGNNIIVGNNDRSPVCVTSMKDDDEELPSQTSERCISRMERVLQLTPESEYEGEGCGSEVSGDGLLLFQSQEVKKKIKPTKSKLSIYTKQAAGGTRRGKNREDTTLRSQYNTDCHDNRENTTLRPQYDTDFHDGSPVSSMDVPNMTKDFHSVGPVKTYSKASIRQHHKSSMVKQWIEEAQHATDKEDFSQNDCLASSHGNTMLTNIGDSEPQVDSEFENFGFEFSEKDSENGKRPSVSKQVGGTQKARQLTQAPATNRKRMFKAKATKELEVVSAGGKTRESDLPSSDPYEFKSSQTMQPKQKIQKKRGRKTRKGNKKGNKGSLVDVPAMEATVSEAGQAVEVEQTDGTTRKDRKTKHVHFDVKSPEQEMSSLIEKIGDAEDHDFAFCTQDAVSNMAGQEGDGAQQGFDDVINEDIEMIEDTDGASCGNRQTDGVMSQTANSNFSNSNDTEKSQTMSIIPPTPMLSAVTDKPMSKIPRSPVTNLHVQISKETTDQRNEEMLQTESDSCGQTPLPIPRRKSTSDVKTKTRTLNLDVVGVPSRAENSAQSHISPTPSVELVNEQDNTVRQDDDITQDNPPSSGNSSATEDLNISLDNTQFEEADLDIQPDEIKKQLSQMSNSISSSAEERHLDDRSTGKDDTDKTLHQGRKCSAASKQTNTDDGQSVVSQNQEPSHCGQSVVSQNQEPSQCGQSVVSQNQEPSHCGQSVVSQNPEPSQCGQSVVSQNQEPSQCGQSVVSQNQEPSHCGQSVVSQNPEPSHCEQSVVSQNPEPSHCGQSVVSQNQEPSQCGQSVVSQNQEPSQCGQSVVSQNQEPSQCGQSVVNQKQDPSQCRQSVVNPKQDPSQCRQSSTSRIHDCAEERQSNNPGCSQEYQGAEDEVVTITMDSASTTSNVSQNSQYVTGAEKLGSANPGSVFTKDEDSCEDNGMSMDTESAIRNVKSQSGDVIPESIEEESVNLIEDTVETSSERSTRSLRARAGRHQAHGLTTSKSRLSRRNLTKDPVIEVACSDVEEPVACDVTDSQQEKKKSRNEILGISLVHSQASTLSTSVPLGSDEQTLPPDVGVSDNEEVADVVEIDGGASEASVDVPETVTESLSILEQLDEQDPASGKSGQASTVESVSILKADSSFKTSRAGNKKNQQKGSAGQGIRQNIQAVGKRSKCQKRKRSEASDSDEEVSSLLQDTAKTSSVPAVSSAPVTITLDDSDDEPLVIHRPKRKCFSLDGSPLRARAKESRIKLSRRAKPSAKKSLDVTKSCDTVDHEPMDTGLCETTESRIDCDGHDLNTNSVSGTVSKESDIVLEKQDPQCGDDSPQLVNTLSDSSQVQESMTDIFKRNTDQLLTLDDASQNTLVPICLDDDEEVDRPTLSPKQTPVKGKRSQFSDSDSDSSDSDTSRSTRSVKKGVKAARGLTSLKKKKSSEETADSPIVISSSKSSGKVAEGEDRVKSQSTTSQERCPTGKRQLSLTDSECVGPTPDVARAGQESRNESQKKNDPTEKNKRVLACDAEDDASVDSPGRELSGRSRRKKNGLKQRHKGDSASQVGVSRIQPSTKDKTNSKRKTKNVLSSDDEDEATTVESSSCELSGRSKRERNGLKQRHRSKIHLPTVQSSVESKADDDIVVLDDFEEPTPRTDGSSSDEEFVLRDDDEVIRKAEMPEGDGMFADLPQTSSPLLASSPVQDPDNESDEAPIGVRKTSRHAVITDSDDDDDDDFDSCHSDQQMNFTSSSAFSSQSEVLTTQQQGKLEKDLENMREEIKRLEAMKDVAETEGEDGTVVEVAEDIDPGNSVEGNSKMATPDVIPASNKTKDDDNTSDDDDSSDDDLFLSLRSPSPPPDLFLSPRSPSPPPDFDKLPKPRKSAEIVKAFEIIEKYKSPTQSKSSRSRTVLSPLLASNMGNPRSEKIVLITSGLSREQAMSVQEFTKVTGSVFFPKFNKTVTHVVVKKAAGEDRPVCDRTLKYFQGIVGKCWVVSFDWVRDSLLANKPLPEDKYEIVADTVIVEDHHGPRRSRTSLKKLFSGFTLTCIGVSDEMTKEDMSLLLHQGGATLADDPWELGKMAASIPMIIRCLDTEEEAPTKSEVEHFNCFYKHNRLITVSREWVLDSISTWRLQPLNDYVLNSIKDIVLPF